MTGFPAAAMLPAILFRLRQIDAGAVAALESLLAYRHFFAFKFAGDSHYRNHNIRVLCRFDRCGLGLGSYFDQINCACTGPAFVKRYQTLRGGFLSLLQMNVRHSWFADSRCSGTAWQAVFRRSGPWRNCPCPVRQCCNRRFHLLEKSVPLDRQRISVRGLWRNVLRFQINHCPCPRRQHRALRLDTPEENLAVRPGFLPPWSMRTRAPGLLRPAETGCRQRN